MTARERRRLSKSQFASSSGTEVLKWARRSFSALDDGHHQQHLRHNASKPTEGNQSNPSWKSEAPIGPLLVDAETAGSAIQPWPTHQRHASVSASSQAYDDEHSLLNSLSSDSCAQPTTTTTTTTTTTRATTYSSLSLPMAVLADALPGAYHRQTYGATVGYRPPYLSKVQATAAKPSLAGSSLTEGARVTARRDSFMHSRELAMAQSGQPVRQSSQAPVRPGQYNRPRRLSSNSNTSAVSSDSTNTTPRESFESRGRSSSWSSQTSLNSFYSAHSKQQSGQSDSRMQWQRPAPIKTRRRELNPGELFSALPGEVLSVILCHLRELHLTPGSDSCATCWMRDACSVAISSRKLLEYARVALYEDIQLVGPDSLQHRKKYKGAFGTRLVLLRRTLRKSSQLAMIVRILKVPAVPTSVNQEEYLDLVASVIMACPNLERMDGFYPHYDHTFNRYFHALSTRQHLKGMCWVIDPSPSQRQQRLKSNHTNTTAARGPSSSRRPPATEGDMEARQSTDFLGLHLHWRALTTLTLHCRPGASLASNTLLAECIRFLPSLQNLHLSNLPATSFDDASLCSLPPLKKLSLVELPGLSSKGLVAYAMRKASMSLSYLALVHVDLDDLSALVRILANLRSLTSLSIVQDEPPRLPDGETIWLFPYLTSPVLRHLHWDIPLQDPRTSSTDMILARSIAADGFSRLSQLRVPNDPDGIFQDFCRPQSRADLRTDRYRRPNTARVQRSNDKSSHEDRLYSDLHQARMAAQARIEVAERKPRFTVRVINEEGDLVENYGIAPYLGTVGSKIRYHLLPDPGGKDEHGGLVGIRDLLDHGGEVLHGGEYEGKDGAVEGCTGRWNLMSTSPTDRKERDRSLHTERGRWRGSGVVLS